MAKQNTIIDDISEDRLDLRQIKPYLSSNIAYQIEQSRIGEEPSPPVLWGPPGIGKSFFLEQICAEKNYGLVALYLSNTLIHQLTGLPMVKMKDANEEKKFIPWSWPDIFDLKNMKVRPKDENGNELAGEDLAKSGAPIVLFLDDIHLCGPDIQKFLFQLLTQKAINKHKLPSNIVLVLAGNRAEDHAGFRQMNSGISSRVTHFTVKGDPNVWIEDYAFEQGIHQDIIAYIQFSPDKLNGTPLENQAWPSPRTWTEASRQILSFEKEIGRSATTEEMFPIIKAKVGQDHATDFYNFRELLLKWNAPAILDGKVKIYKGSGKTTKTKIYLKDLNQIEAYALLTACIGEISKRLREKDFKVCKETSKIMEFAKENIIEPLALKFRPIVPLALKMLILEETKHRQHATLVKTLLTDEKIVEELLDIM